MKPKLKDVDGTIPGRAALILIDLENPDTRRGFMQSLFVEGEGNCTDPVLSCNALWESTKGDWPRHRMAIVADERAKYIEWNRLMGYDYGPRKYLEILS